VIKQRVTTFAFGAARTLLLAAVLLLTATGSAVADQTRPDMAKQVGEISPLFAVATSQGALANYNRDYYGRRHLVLSFFPAAFTPI